MPPLMRFASRSPAMYLRIIRPSLKVWTAPLPLTSRTAVSPPGVGFGVGVGAGGKGVGVAAPGAEIRADEPWKSKPTAVSMALTLTRVVTPVKPALVVKLVVNRFWGREPGKPPPADPVWAQATRMTMLVDASPSSLPVSAWGSEGPMVN